MEAKSKQEDYQSKLVRNMHNFHHGGDNGFNAYGGNNHRNENFISKRHNGVGNFSSYAKSFEHTSYDDYMGYGRLQILNRDTSRGGDLAKDLDPIQQSKEDSYQSDTRATFN
ncbi:hypothetical protein M9H77_29665 [Catharanthus roseus]|uniref:Uncharacterized protein n=1 Tax=Catharanthus roseus TaxID=4058 RepID=A0ACB9ZZA9_CATRO|nr:hypothetical protein M9H77_29665 [Catharanthus roseus]